MLEMFQWSCEIIWIHVRIVFKFEICLILAGFSIFFYSQKPNFISSILSRFGIWNNLNFQCHHFRIMQKGRRWYGLFKIIGLVANLGPEFPRLKMSIQQGNAENKDDPGIFHLSVWKSILGSYVGIVTKSGYNNCKLRQVSWVIVCPRISRAKLGNGVIKKRKKKKFHGIEVWGIWLMLTMKYEKWSGLCLGDCARMLLCMFKPRKLVAFWFKVCCQLLAFASLGVKQCNFWFLLPCFPL